MKKELWQIPSSWEWTEIKSLGDVVSGGTPSTKEPSYWGDVINWISPADLTGYTKKMIARGAKSISQKGLRKSSAKLIPAGSIHFSSRAPIGYVAISSEPLCTNQGFKSVVPAEGLFNEYLYYYLKASKQLAEQRATGTTFKEISGTAFGKLPAPLAPTNEQKRIVAKIEELFSELDKGIENLNTASEQLKVYRQAVLKHAFEGKLTAGWREENADKHENGEELLKRIKQRREVVYQQQLKEWEVALNTWKESGKEVKKPARPRLSKLKEPVSALESNEICNLPNSWSWVRPEDIASPTPYSIGIGPFGSNLKVPDYRDEGVPLIFVRNITRNDFSLNQKYIDPQKADELHAHIVEPLDIVITKMGDPPGDCQIYPAEAERAVLTADCLKFRVWPDFVERDFYKYCIWSNYVKKQLGLITKGVAQKKISVDRFKTIAVPLPPQVEQKQIVREVEYKFSVIDQLDADIEINLRKCDALRQSILKQAFSGKLVAQDPNDELASVLLERIKEENDKGGKMKKGKAA